MVMGIKVYNIVEYNEFDFEYEAKRNICRLTNRQTELLWVYLENILETENSIGVPESYINDMFGRYIDELCLSVYGVTFSNLLWLEVDDEYITEAWECKLTDIKEVVKRAFTECKNYCTSEIIYHRIMDKLNNSSMTLFVDYYVNECEDSSCNKRYELSINACLDNLNDIGFDVKGVSIEEILERI